MPTFITALLIVSTLGTGVMAGVFFAFSGFVTQGIDRLPAEDAARAMRGINVTAVRAPLMLALFGTGLVMLVVLGFAFTGALGDATWWAVTAAAVYLVGAIVVTGAANVPRNNRLAAATNEAGPLASAWNEFRPGWQAWNHVRTIACAAACVGFAIALVVA